MKERPILFNAEMVRAILDGRKTQTRRVLKPQPRAEYVHTDRTAMVDLCPYGVPGDRLWVRETWSIDPSEGDVTYAADGATERFLDMGSSGIVGKPGKHPSIFMPRALSRITLEVTGVRVERVQDISEEDAGAEGTPCIFCRRNLVTKCQCALDKADYHEDFQQLWDGINAKKGFGWEANPWVWVVEFEAVS